MARTAMQLLRSLGRFLIDAFKSYDYGKFVVGLVVTALIGVIGTIAFYYFFADDPDLRSSMVRQIEKQLADRLRGDGRGGYIALDKYKIVVQTDGLSGTSVYAFYGSVGGEDSSKSLHPTWTVAIFESRTAPLLKYILGQKTLLAPTFFATLASENLLTEIDQLTILRDGSGAASIVMLSAAQGNADLNIGGFAILARSKEGWRQLDCAGAVSTAEEKQIDMVLLTDRDKEIPIRSYVGLQVEFKELAHLRWRVVGFSDFFDYYNNVQTYTMMVWSFDGESCSRDLNWNGGQDLVLAPSQLRRTSNPKAAMYARGEGRAVPERANPPKRGR